MERNLASTVKYLGLTIVFLSLIGKGFSQQKNELYYLGKAGESLKNKDFKNHLTNLLKVEEYVQDFPYLYYNIAKAYRLNNNDSLAVIYLNKVAELGGGFQMEEDSIFKPMLKNSDYIRVVDKIKSNRTFEHKSDTALIIKVQELIPEGLAFDPRSKSFYISSIYHKNVISIDSNGKAQNFVDRGQYGMEDVLGMKIAPDNRKLWVCSAILGHLVNNKRSSKILQFDLDSKTLVKEYVINDTIQHPYFNDIVLNTSGDVFMTDSEGGRVFWIDHETDKLELFIESDDLVYPNGIAISEDKQLLFIASIRGVVRIDIRKRTSKLLNSDKSINRSAFDGLYWYNNTLIGIHNNAVPESIYQLRLNKSNSKIIDFKVLESNHPASDIPTTGVIDGDQFYFIANSQMDHLSDSGIIDSEQLKNTIILKLDLEK